MNVFHRYASGDVSTNSLRRDISRDDCVILFLRDASRDDYRSSSRRDAYRDDCRTLHLREVSRDDSMCTVIEIPL